MSTKAYSSVKDMLRDTIGTEAVQGMEEHQAATQLVSQLIHMRCEKGLSQRQVAKAMGCSPSKVCRIEAAADADITWGDIAAYTRAIGMSSHLTFEDLSLPAAQRIKTHVFAIKEQLDSLADLATKQNDDPSLVAKIHQFYGEVLFNFAMRFGDSYQKLPQAITIGAKPTGDNAKPAKLSSSARCVPA